MAWARVVEAVFKLLQLAALAAVVALSAVGLAEVDLNQWIVLGWMSAFSLVVAVSALLPPLRARLPCLQGTARTAPIVALLFGFAAAPRVLDPATLISFAGMGACVLFFLFGCVCERRTGRPPPPPSADDARVFASLGQL